MNRFEWLRSSDALLLLDFLFPQHGYHSTPQQTRKMRLYLASLCRIAWRELPAVCQATTEVIEQLADEHQLNDAVAVTVRQVAEAMTTSWENEERIAHCEESLLKFNIPIPTLKARRWTESDWRRLTWLAYLPHWNEQPPYRWIAPSDHRADLVRDVFGLPFHHPTFDPTWLTTTVKDLALSMYSTRQFSAMPILADALEEAGCQNVEVLDHCRDVLPHTRGCWVLDHILGKG